MDILTYPMVEEVVKRRVEMKATVYGQEVTTDAPKAESRASYKIKPSLVADLYGDWIMPLTKEVQVQYLLRRLDWWSYLNLRSQVEAVFGLWNCWLVFAANLICVIWFSTRFSKLFYLFNVGYKNNALL